MATLLLSPQSLIHYSSGAQKGIFDKSKKMLSSSIALGGNLAGHYTCSSSV